MIATLETTMTCPSCFTEQPKGDFEGRDVCHACAGTLARQTMNVLLNFTKYCDYCGTYEPLTAFRVDQGTHMRNICVEGERAYRKKRREEGFNDKGYRNRWYTTLREVLRTEHSCMQCGDSQGPFHLLHLDREAKSFTIGEKALSHDMTVLRREIEKCDVFCAACSYEIQQSAAFANNAMRKKPWTPWQNIFDSVDALTPPKLRATADVQMTLFP